MTLRPRFSARDGDRCNPPQFESDERCPLPPQGWVCTRTPGHGGPCAAVPVHVNADGDLTEEEWATLSVLIHRAFAQAKAAR